METGSDVARGQALGIPKAFPRVQWPFLHDRRGARRYSAAEVREAAEAHEQDRIGLVAEQDGATGRSAYLGNAVYGALDGVITTFAIVSGVVGARLSPDIILILGCANLLGDGFSMATGAFLSARSEQEVYCRERQHAAEQIARQPEKEEEALLELYRRQNYPEEDARALCAITSRDPGRWVSTMMTERLLLLPQKRRPLMEGAATFAAFVLAGVVPLAVYLLDLLFDAGLSPWRSFLWAAALSAAALLSTGAAKGAVTGRNPLRSALEMAGVGGLAALVAFGVGALLKNLAGAG